MAVNTTADSIPLTTCVTVQDAAAIVKKNFFCDRESFDLSEQLNISSLYSGVCSGLKEEDYPVIEDVNIPLLTDVRRVPLPPELVEQFGHMQCNCIMGIFPEIGRAWLTVDSDIFVWRYTDGDDLAYFDGLAETILSVSLVQPKIGIFRDHIKYLLVLTTPLDVVMLGVSFAEDDISNEMHLLPDPLFTISSDNAYLLHTVGTLHGRIFTGGKDGCLYEIAYQAKRGWFSRSCTKINHSRSRLSFLLPSLVSMWLNEEDSISQLCVDDTRNILYTRSEKGTISVYDLGADGLSTSCVAQLRLDSIQRRARDIASGIEPSNLNELVHIAPITRRESRYMHLVAVTQAGVRLYFMTFQSSGLPIAQTGGLSKLRPNGIYLVHVRLPPGFTGTSLQRPSAVHAAHYNTGTLLLSASSGDDGILWCVTKDTFAFAKVLKETHSNFSLDGRAWAISEVTSPFTPEIAAVIPFGSITPIPPDPPIQVIQHIQRPSEYVIVTSQGCHIFSKMRPVDQLRFLLENVSDPDCRAVEAFFKLYNNGEAASSCIILAMSPVPTDRAIGERAVMALVHFGGITLHPCFNQGVQNQSMMGTGDRRLPIGPMSPISHSQSYLPPELPSSVTMRTPCGLPVVSTPMAGHNPPPPAGTTMQYPSNPAPGSNLPVDSTNTVIYYSERQHGAFKMFSRITRPLWEGRLVEDYLVEEDGKKRNFVVSRLDVDVVSSVLDQLNALKIFVGKHCLTQVQLRDFSQSTRDHEAAARSFYFSQNAPGMAHDHHKSRLVEMARSELTAMKCLYELLLRSSEVLALWRILLHHQIHVLFDALDQQNQATLKAITFQDLVLNGEATCSALVSVLINQFMDDNITIDALNGQLREVCPSLYSADDAIASKASELLRAVKKSSGSLREENLQRSSQLFQQIAGSVNLAAVIQQYVSVRCYTDAVELCIKAAQAKDENEIAVKLYHSEFTANDTQVDPVFRKAYLARMECYKYITDILDELSEISVAPPQAPSVPLSPGPPKPTEDTNASGVKPLKPEEAQIIADDCLQLAIQSNHELLHVTVYEWLLRKGMANTLLQINSPYIEPFLRRIADSRDDVPAPSESSVNLLWQHHERCGQHVLAAEVLLGLAEKPGSDRDLARRIEYLSRAKVNAKSVTSAIADSATGGALLHEIEEKIDVAQIQMETLHHLRELNETETINRLNSNLYDVTTLYSDFADPFQLAEIKLAIAHCSGLHDDSLVRALWKNIIEDELQRHSSFSESNAAAALKNKILQLSQRYRSTHRYFPVDYLIVFLEKLSCKRKWDLDWVFVCMLEADVEINDILDVYIKTHAHKLPFWSSCSKPYHLLWVQNEILRVFLLEPAKFMPSLPNRRRFVNYLLDAIAVNLVQLRSITSPSENVLELIAEFRRNQAVLETMQEQQR